MHDKISINIPGVTPKHANVIKRSARSKFYYEFKNRAEVVNNSFRNLFQLHIRTGEFKILKNLRNIGVFLTAFKLNNITKANGRILEFTYVN